MAARILTPEQIVELVDLRERGLSYGAIARRFGVSPGAVAWHCLKEAAERPGQPPKPRDVPTEPRIYRRGKHVVRGFTQAEDQLLLELERTGMHLSQIAKRLGRQRNSIVGRLMTLARRDERQDAFASASK